jgi:formylglycine-generating enzyme required for sulfatase activity
MTSDKDGMVMVYVPEGSFTMGNDNGYSHEKPAHKVFLDAYWIDSTEVTNGQYAMCVQSGVCSDPVWQGGYSPDYFKQAEYSNYPMVRINWKEAQSYCQWAGKRLPTEAEWEKAARGTDERIYPWGNNPPSCDLANLSKCINPPDFSPVLSLKTVGSYPEGVSPYKAYDMLGNTWEWVADWFSETYYSQSPERNPTGPSTGQYRILRGGSAYENARVVSRLWTGPKQWGPYYGVRCVKDVSK